MSNKLIVKILMSIFAVRPIIDLFYGFSIAGINPAGMVALFVTVLALFSIGLNGFKLKMTYPMFFFALYTLFITVINTRSFSDIADWLRIFSSIAFFFAVAPFIHTETFMKYVRVFLVATLVPIVLTFLQVAKIVPYQYYDWISGIHVSRATGGYPQPAVLTRFLVFGLLYALYLFTTVQRKKQKMLLLIYCILNLAAVFFSYHRTGYFLSILIIFLYTCFHYRGSLKKILPKMIAVILVAVVVIAFLNYYGLIQLDSSGFEKLLGFDNILRTKNGTTTLHLRGRGAIASQYLGELFSTPDCIVGFGKDLNEATGSVLVDADMDIIRILWSYGIIGFILWILMIFSLIKIVFIETRRIHHEFINVAKISLIIYLVFGLTMDTIIMPNFMIHVYMLAGLTKYRAWTTDNEVPSSSRVINRRLKGGNA